MENKIVIGFNFSPRNIQAIHDPKKRIVTISENDKKVVMREEEFCQTARWLSEIADKIEGKL